MQNNSISVLPSLLPFKFLANFIQRILVKIRAQKKAPEFPKLFLNPPLSELKSRGLQTYDTDQSLDLVIEKKLKIFLI